MATDPAFPEVRDLPPGPDELHRAHGLDEVQAGAEPLDSVQDLFVEGLTHEEADAFLAAIGG